jgi:hypothetical protein
MSTTIQVKRGNAANWASTNPVLATGEWGMETDTGKTKLGNGTTAWNSLPYKDGDLSGYQQTSEKGNANGYAGLNANAKVPVGFLPDATETGKGIIQIATDAEITTGTDTSKAVTPKQLKDSTPDVSGFLPKSGGTMTGALMAEDNTDYTAAQARNIAASTTDLTAGTSVLASGQIYLVYE